MSNQDPMEGINQAFAKQIALKTILKESITN